MYLKRNIDKSLLEWKESNDRKPLLVRGARQVGKSSSIRNLGKSFEFFLEVNFEKRSDIADLFSENLDVKEIVNRLGRIFNIPVIEGKTLVFFDEIQACPNALKSLWFFKEDYPELHVVAAGSLLEFALKDISSFGVGRIHSMFMYPLSFDEFLMAQGKDDWVEEIRMSGISSPIFEQLHNQLIQQFRQFMVIGGMPASVVAWTKTGDYLQCAKEQEDILKSYYDDFAKYSSKLNKDIIRATLQSVALQVGKKFVLSHVNPSYRVREIKSALELLCQAGIIKRVSMSVAYGLPLGATVNPKFSKYLYLDSGLLLRMLDAGLDSETKVVTDILVGLASDLVNKGSITEMVAGWEIIKSHNPDFSSELFYWENLKNGAISKVDYIITRKGKIVPIEVKSGTSGKMKSLFLFMKNKKIDNGIRVSLENFSKIEHTDNQDNSKYTIIICPIYALSNIIKS